ncbi:MAG: tetraacyldisaccharide 4'-kinase [bacterium]|nr:tetraacyldisaccharide 4'-kinase [bacterium]
MENFWTRVAGNPLGSGLLRLFSGFYALLLRARELVFRLGLIRSRSFPVPVISVGNLHLGGTGKTPLVRFLAEKFSLSGIRPAVLTRGYGRSGKTEIIISGTGKNEPDSAQVGDEPFLLSRWLPGVKIGVGKDRRRSGELLFRQGSPQVILLDDGFSHHRLKKDLEILTVPARPGPLDRRLFPRGTLREPFSGIRRADLIVISGENPDPEWQAELAREHPGGVFFRARFQINQYRPLGAKARPGDLPGMRPAGFFRGRAALGLAGIGRPESFFASLEKEGAQIREKVVYPDHFPYGEKDLARIERRAREQGIDLILTTEKDGARLEKLRRTGPPAGPEWWEARGELRLERGEELFRMILARLRDRSPAIFMDRDGTINEDNGYLTRPEDLKIIPGAEAAIRRINAGPYLAVLISNQSVVNRGMASENRVRVVELRLEELLGAGGAFLDGAYYCPHRPDEGCACRKPETGLVRKAVSDLGIALEASYYIGDKDTDIELARRLGIKAVRVGPPPDHAPGVPADFVARDLAHAVDWIMGNVTV